MADYSQSNSHLFHAIQDAGLLLVYVGQNGITLDDHTLNILVNAKYRQAWTDEAEADFWQAFNTISQAVRPVTVESLKAVSVLEGKTNWFQSLKLSKKAYRSVYTTIALTVLTMFTLLLLQLYWLIGTKLSKNIDVLFRQGEELSQLEGYPEKYEQESYELRMQIATNQNILLLWSRVWLPILQIIEGEEQEKTFSREDYKGQIQAFQEQLKVVGTKLYRSKNFSFDLGARELILLYQKHVNELTEQLIHTKTAYEKDKNNYERSRIQLQTLYVLDTVQTYILPMLYGLLGSLAYILRSLIDNIQHATYTHKTSVKYRVRVFLGILIGPIIGYFITPTEIADLGKLTPMALSFLAGYNVEILFSTMDNFVASISKRTQATKQPVVSPSQTQES